MEVDYITNSVFSSRTYILSDDESDKVWLVDCGDVDRVIERIGEKSIEGVLLTHTHSDHIYGLPRLLETFPQIKIITNEYGRTALTNPKLNISRYHEEFEDITVVADENVVTVKEGDKIVGLDVIETPGHDPSCLCFMNAGCIFTGDSFIPGLAVFAGFPKSNKKDAVASKERIESLALDRAVFPGHS